MTYLLCDLYTEKKSLLMKGDIASSNAFGHSSWGRWPHPDIATSLCTSNGQDKYQQTFKIKIVKGRKKPLLWSTPYQAWINRQYLQNLQICRPLLDNISLRQVNLQHRLWPTRECLLQLVATSLHLLQKGRFPMTIYQSRAVLHPILLHIVEPKHLFKNNYK